MRSKRLIILYSEIFVFNWNSTVWICCNNIFLWFWYDGDYSEWKVHIFSFCRIFVDVLLKWMISIWAFPFNSNYFLKVLLASNKTCLNAISLLSESISLVLDKRSLSFLWSRSLKRPQPTQHHLKGWKGLLFTLIVAILWI